MYYSKVQVEGVFWTGEIGGRQLKHSHPSISIQSNTKHNALLNNEQLIRALYKHIPNNKALECTHTNAYEYK